MSELILEYVKIRHHNKEIINVHFCNTCNSSSDREKIFTTLILGVNGSGKSYLLTIIANVFIFIEKAQNYKRKPKFRYDQFSIAYQINRHIYKVERFSGNKIECYKDNEIINLEDLVLPQKILAVSFLVNDKFLFSNPEYEKSISVYTYLGVRKTTNATYTSSIVQNVMRNFLEITLLKEFTELIKILSLLKFDKIIQLKFKRMGMSKSSKRDIDSILNNSIWDENVLIDYGNILDSNLLFMREKKESILALLNDGRLVLSNIYFYKMGELIPFEDCSSGEKHLIFSLTGIMCHIMSSSLVLIDEPEISLHPEWQTKYIDLIKELFGKYASCHFVIASHSHYLVSDLEPSTSSIVLMKKEIEETSPSAELLPYSTYAWSAENVIYNVFGVRTTRNYYFEADLRKLINLMNTDDGTGSKVDEVQYLVDKIKRYVFDTVDPLNIIVEQAQEFCNVYRKID